MKFNNISLLKNYGIILVIIGHSLSVFRGDHPFISTISSTFLRDLSYYISMYHMPLFFFASGFIYKYKLPKTQSDFIKKKTLRLIIPYFSVGILYLIPIWLYTKVYHGAKDVLWGFFLSNNPGHLWFVLALFHVFIFFHLFKKWIFKTSPWVAFLIFYLFSRVASHLPYFQMDNAMRYVIYFYLGSIIFENKNNFENVKYITPILFILHIITSALILHKVKIGMGGAVIAVLLFYLISSKLINLHPYLVLNSVYKVIDKNNYLLYLFHEPLMFIFYYHFAKCGFNPYILVTGCLIFSVTISLLICKIVWKFKYLCILIGSNKMIPSKN
jgi:fucose 4-O-acetylase-like acetyltransferase